MTEITQADHKAAEKAQWDAVVRVGSLAEAFARHREKAAAEERAKIVAWLRRQSEYGSDLAQAWGETFAELIEAGEHETFTRSDNV
jgi:hypothetical protein